MVSERRKTDAQNLTDVVEDNPDPVSRLRNVSRFETHPDEDQTVFPNSEVPHPMMRIEADDLSGLYPHLLLPQALQRTHPSW